MLGKKAKGEVVGEDARRRWEVGEPLRGPHFGAERLEVEVYLLVRLRLGDCGFVVGIIAVNFGKIRTFRKLEDDDRRKQARCRSAQPGDGVTSVTRLTALKVTIV